MKMGFWKPKKYIFVLESKKKDSKKPKKRIYKVGVFFAIFAVFVMVVFSVEYEKARLKRRQTVLEMLSIKEMAELYLVEQGKCPQFVEELSGVDFSLRMKPKIEYLDPWGKKFEIVCPGKKNQEGVDVISAGPDGNFFTNDDVKL